MAPSFDEKKKILSDAIRSLFGYWDLAEGMYTLVTSQHVTEDILDGLLEIICVSIQHVQTIDGQEKMLWIRTTLERFKAEEIKQKMAERNAATQSMSQLF